jgi:hypothetical protein
MADLVGRCPVFRDPSQVACAQTVQVLKNGFEKPSQLHCAESTLAIQGPAIKAPATTLLCGQLLGTQFVSHLVLYLKIFSRMRQKIGESTHGQAKRVT